MSSKVTFIDHGGNWAWATLKFLVVISTRFFLGMPMNGKRKDNSSFLRGATRGRAGSKKVLTRWQKRPWIHRALIRGAVFWPTLSLLTGLIIDRDTALLALALCSPFLGFYGGRKAKLIFMQPSMSTDAVTGLRIQHWTLRLKYRKLFRRQYVPGLLTRKNAIDDTLPPAVQEAILADINNNQFKGEMPATNVKRITDRGRRKRWEVAQ